LIILQAMQKDPRHRYASAADLADDLDRYLRNDSVRARIPGLALRVARCVGWRRTLTAAVILGLVAALGIQLRKPSPSNADASRQAIVPLDPLRERIDRFRGEPRITPEIVHRYESELRQEAQRILARFPRSAEVHLEMARFYIEARKLDQALQSLNQAVSCDPCHSYAYLHRARLSLREYLRRRIELMTSSTLTYPVRSEPEPEESAELRTLRTQVQSDLQEFQRLTRDASERPPESCFARGILALYEEEWPSAAAAFRAATPSLSLGEDAWALLAVSENRCRRYDASEEALRRLEIQPERLAETRLWITVWLLADLREADVHRSSRREITRALLRNLRELIRIWPDIETREVFAKLPAFLRKEVGDWFQRLLKGDDSE
jgi:tetratricopeptide (TPR) repeat protein